MDHQIKNLLRKIHLLEKKIEKIKNWLWLKYEDEIPQEILSLKDEPDLDLELDLQLDLVKAVKKEQFESILPDDIDNDFEPVDADSYDNDEVDYDHDHQEKLVKIPIKNEIVISTPSLCINDTQKQKLIEDCYKKVAVIHLERFPNLPDFLLQRDVKETSRTRSGSRLELKPIQIKRRFRTKFTQEQIASLKSHFKVQHYLEKSDLERISKELILLPKVIASWFNKQRIIEGVCVLKKSLNGEAISGSGPSSSLNTFRRKKKSRPRVRQSYPIKCDQSDCTYIISSHKNYKRHKKTHSDDYNTNRYLTSCLVKDCQSAVLKHKLKDHMDSFHSPLSFGEPKPVIFQCPECLIESSSRTSIQKHICVKHRTLEDNNNIKKTRIVRNRSKSTKSICHLCGNKCFGLQGHLQRYHFNPRQYKCQAEGCSWAFNEKTHLIEHQRVHWSKEARKEWRNSRKRPCTICGEMIMPVLMKKHTLLKHQKKDHNLVCNIGGCQRAFALKHILWEHYRVHMNQKRDDYNEEFTKNCPEEILKFLKSRRESVKKYATKYNAQKREMKKSSYSYLILPETEPDPPKTDTENLDEFKELEYILKDPTSSIQVQVLL